MDTLINQILKFLSNLPKEWVIVVIAALPIGELRFSIPIGIYLLGKSAILKVFILSLAGNILPIVPVLLLLSPVAESLRHFRLWRKFFDWFSERTRKKADIIQRYEALGLALFVAVPLPGTGAWAGCLAASLFKIRFRYAFLSIVAGVVLAGIIVVVLSWTGFFVWQNMR